MYTNGKTYNRTIKRIYTSKRKFTQIQVLKTAEYFTLTPAKDGWENVTYYTAKKRGIYNKKGEGDQWVYVLRNSSMPGLYKVGYTKLTPDERAKQLSNATGVPVP